MERSGVQDTGLKPGQPCTTQTAVVCNEMNSQGERVLWPFGIALTSGGDDFLKFIMPPFLLRYN